MHVMSECLTGGLSRRATEFISTSNRKGGVCTTKGSMCAELRKVCRLMDPTKARATVKLQCVTHVIHTYGMTHGLQRACRDNYVMI